MIGYVTPHEITIWARINGSFPFYVEYDEHPDFSNARKTEPITASRDEDYTVRVQLTDLKPDTVYYYRAFVNNHADPYVKYSPALSCKTAPETPARFRVAFGSCARIQRDPIQPIWNVVQNWNPDLFIWLGDNIYGDSPDIDILREEYRRQREVPSSLPVLRSIPQLAVWDDHDYALNNHDRTNPAKEKALQAFQEYWANPAYGLPEVPGVFFDYQYGGVDFFFLDVRYHRSPNEEEDGESKTMLGAEQLEWLKTKLSESKAPFKVLVSGSGWSSAKGGGGDSWAAFLQERDHLFTFIRDQEIGGVILLSGDTHVGELNAIPWSENGGYDFYDLVSSPLAQPPGTNWTNRRPELRIRQVHDTSPNVGIVEFDLTQEPTLTFRLIDIYGNQVWQPFVITAAELKNGVKTWDQKMDGASKRRYQSEQDGRDYYAP